MARPARGACRQPLRDVGAAGLPDAARAGRAFGRGILSVALAFLLALAPVSVQFSNTLGNEAFMFGNSGGLDVRKSEANAFAPVVAGGAAALAAELGISTTALYAGLAAMATAATGVYFYNAGANAAASSWPTDIALPGFRPWDDLSVDEKRLWGDNGQGAENATNEGYWQNQYDILALQMGFEISNSETGGNMPTPEPEDPDERNSWQKKRNVLALLATGGVVALADVVGAAGEDFINSLFKPETDDNATSGLGIPYREYATVSNKEIQFMTPPLSTWCTYKWGSRTNYATYQDWIYAVNSNGTIHYYCKTDGYGVPVSWPTLTFRNDSTSYYLNYSSSMMGYYNLSYDKESSHSTSTGYTFNLGTDGNVYLNPNYKGIYNFGSVASLDNGTWSGDYSHGIEYPSIEDTPGDLINNINNYENLNNWANYYQNAPDGQTRAVSIPSEFTGPDGAPSYDDYVKPYEETDVDTPSEEEPYDPDAPKPEPPKPEFDFNSELADVTGKLQNVVFEQLFPFCLIGDLRQLVTDINSGVASGEIEGGGGGLRVQADEDTGDTTSAILRLDFSGFGIDGLEVIELDFTPLIDGAQIVKPWWTLLVAVYLLQWSIRWFLKA